MVAATKRVDVGDRTGKCDGNGPEDDQAEIGSPGEQVAKLHFVSAVINLGYLVRGKAMQELRWW